MPRYIEGLKERLVSHYWVLVLLGVALCAIMVLFNPWEEAKAAVYTAIGGVLFAIMLEEVSALWAQREVRRFLDSLGIPLPDQKEEG